MIFFLPKIYIKVWKARRKRYNEKKKVSCQLSGSENSIFSWGYEKHPITRGFGIGWTDKHVILSLWTGSVSTSFLFVAFIGTPIYYLVICFSFFFLLIFFYYDNFSYSYEFTYFFHILFYI